MSAKTLLGILMFLSILTIFIGATAVTSVQYQSPAIFTNQSNTNLTQISTISTATLCKYKSDIPVVSGILWGADCTAGYIGFIFSWASFSVGIDIEYLIAIVGVLVAVLIYIGIRLLRG